MYQTYLVYTWHIPCICMVYVLHILVSVIFFFCRLSKKQSRLDGLEISVPCMEFQNNYLIALKKHDLMSDRINQGYTRCIQCIYQTCTMWRSLASPLSCPSALGSLGPGLPSDLFSLGHREAADARLGPSKVPQPGVDLVNMAAPPRGRASTIGTAALKSVQLLAAVLM